MRRKVRMARRKHNWKRGFMVHGKERVREREEQRDKTSEILFVAHQGHKPMKLLNYRNL